MRGTSHPSIVKLLSFSESEAHYFLVMERVYYCKQCVGQFADLHIV
jgi:hypothetical protein